MRIALVILHADPSRGGAERYTLDLAAALAREGHEVALLAASFADVPPDVARVQLGHRGVTRAGRYDSFIRSLDRHLDATRYDVVHAMLPVPRCDVYHPHAGLAVAAVDEGSRVSTMFNPRRSRYAEVERALLASPHGPVVLALSDYVRHAIRKYYALEESKLATLFNAVDLAHFKPSRTSAPHETVRALFIGQDFRRKGLVETLAAMKSLASERLTLTVVGRHSGTFRVPDERDPRITFAGETRDTRRFYNDADFFVLPTRHDPCSLVVLEALAMGLPVISTRFNGACEIMTDGVHGFVLDDPGDVAALAAAMRKLLDPDLRARMSRACLELRPTLSYEHHLRTLMQIYDQVVARQPPAVTRLDADGEGP